MTCCGKIKSVSNIAQGNINLIAEKLFRLDTLRHEQGEARQRICMSCEYQTWLTKGFYLSWLAKNMLVITTHIEDLTMLPDLPKEENGKGKKLFCVKCKCWIVAKTRAADASCPIGKWAPDLISITIPARNEIHLNQTIESILQTATGNYEIIVGMDGWTIPYEVMKHPKVTVIAEPTAVGRRKIANKIAAAAKGQYIVKLDAHCIYKTPGWNEKLKEVCTPDTIVTCVMDNIDEATWQPMGKKWMGWLFNREFRTQWWTSMKPQKNWNLTEEILCFSASTCMMTKETFWKYGGNREEFGHWGNEELEWALKVRCGGGKLICRTDVEVAHLYRAKFPYKFKSTIGANIDTLQKEYPESRTKPVIDHFRAMYGIVPGWDTPPFSRGSISAHNWNQLQQIIKVHGIKSVVEFGTGLSTELLDTIVKVESYETKPEWIEKTKPRTKQTTFHQWDGKTPPPIAGDMAFIDGPFGGKNREASYAAVANSRINLVACHDVNRADDQVWIKKYFSDWQQIGVKNEKQTLIILRRNDTKDNQTY